MSGRRAKLLSRLYRAHCGPKGNKRVSLRRFRKDYTTTGTARLRELLVETLQFNETVKRGR